MYMLSMDNSNIYLWGRPLRGAEDEVLKLTEGMGGKEWTQVQEE
jgi:hypothetical protein